MVTPEYYMDEMCPYELGVYLDTFNYSWRPLMEMLRLSPFITLRMNSKKKSKVTDLVAFPWDDVPQNRKSQKPDLPKTISNDEIARLKAKASALSQSIQNT